MCYLIGLNKYTLQDTININVFVFEVFNSTTIVPYLTNSKTQRFNLLRPSDA